jgi:hypothetical protein
LFGCLVVWLFGCLVVWLFGSCLVVWVFGCWLLSLLLVKVLVAVLRMQTIGAGALVVVVGHSRDIALSRRAKGHHS